MSSLAVRWPLPGAPCDLHGVFVTWFHLLSFALVMLIFVERVVKAWNVTLHTATFNTHAFVVVISVVVWATDLLVALLPVLGIGWVQRGFGMDTYSQDVVWVQPRC